MGNILQTFTIAQCVNGKKYILKPTEFYDPFIFAIVYSVRWHVLEIPREITFIKFRPALKKRLL